MENLWFLILIAIVGFVQWIMGIIEERKNAEAEKRAGQPRPSAPPPVTAAPRTQTTEEERVRKFMEALGVPTETAPPPPRRTPPPQVQPAQGRESRPPQTPKVRPIDPFPVPRTATRPPPAPVQPPPIAPPVAPSLPPTYDRPLVLPKRETTTFTTPLKPETVQTVPSAFEVQDLSADVADDLVLSRPGKQPASGMAPTAGLTARLANSEGLREAIVLREIFGPPRSMQPLDPQNRA